jgi:hypothetical protein
MPEAKSTKLNIREDRPTALASSVHGSNIDAIGFNLLFIAQRNPKLAVEIMKLYTLAHKVRENDPSAPNEDFALFADEVAKVLADKSDE